MKNSKRLFYWNTATFEWKVDSRKSEVITMIDFACSRSHISFQSIGSQNDYTDLFRERFQMFLTEYCPNPILIFNILWLPATGATYPFRALDNKNHICRNVSDFVYLFLYTRNLRRWKYLSEHLTLLTFVIMLHAEHPLFKQ